MNPAQPMQHNNWDQPAPSDPIRDRQHQPKTGMNKQMSDTTNRGPANQAHVSGIP